MIFDNPLLEEGVVTTLFKHSRPVRETGYCVIDSSGQITAHNATLTALLHARKASLVGTDVLVFFNLSKDLLQEVQTQGEIVREVRYHKRHLHLHFNRLVTAKKELEIGLLVCDLSDELRFINDMTRSFNDMEALIDKFDIGFVILDENHQIIEANSTFCNNLGYTKADTLQLSGKDYIVDFENRVLSVNKDLDKIFYFGEDNRHIRKDGKMIPVKGFSTRTLIDGRQVAFCFYQNITEQMESSARLEQSEMMLKNFITNSTDAIMVLDKSLEVTYLSPNTKRVFGYSKNISRQEVIERYLPLNEDNFIHYARNNLKLRDSLKEYEYTIKNANNKQRHYSIRTSSIKVKDKMLICYIRDVTKDKKYIEELKILSYTDQLTKLHNRQYMEEQLLELRKPENFPISIISADLDGLKEVNDSLGHQAGDELLRRFANILREAHDKYEEIFRIGGDEFIIIATHTTSVSAQHLIKKIDKKIAMHNSLPSSSLKISASVGYATSDDFMISLSPMLAQADKDMYCIKNAKKN